MADTIIDRERVEGLGFAGTERVPAFRSRQGEHERYTFAMPVGTAIQSIRKPDPEQPFPGNRKVEPGRARKFMDYLESNALGGTWTCPPIQLRAAPSDILSVEVIAESARLVEVELPKHRRWDIQDGQHRMLGFDMFRERSEGEIARLRDLRAKAERSGEPASVKHYTEQLVEQERRHTAILDKAHVEVVVVVADDGDHGQMFADIAINAKGVNPDYAATLDQRDPVNRIATNLIERFPPLDGLVSDGQQGRLAPNSPFLLGTKSIADVARGVAVGTGRVGKRARDEIERDEAKWTRRITEFLATAFESFEDLQRLTSGEIDAPQLREESLLGSATTLRVLAIAWHEMLYADDPLTVGDVKRFFAELDPHMRCFGEVRAPNARGEMVTRIGVMADHPIWGPTGKFQLGWKAPSGRISDVNDLGRTIASWGRHGLPA